MPTSCAARIECDPGHHFGMDEVLASGRTLPNPFIRLPPWASARYSKISRRTASGYTRPAYAGLVRLKRRVRDFAEDIVDLHLIASRVSGSAPAKNPRSP